MSRDTEIRKGRGGRAAGFGTSGLDTNSEAEDDVTTDPTAVNPISIRLNDRIYRIEGTRPDLTAAAEVDGGPPAIAGPLRVLGPSVHTLEYIVSAPPSLPVVFASSKYRSIRRKLIVDVRDLTLGFCFPRNHPLLEKRKTRKRSSSEFAEDVAKAKVRSTVSVIVPDNSQISDHGVDTREVVGEEYEEETIEASLPVEQQTFQPETRPLPLKHVLNTSAVLPHAGGVLELTLEAKHKGHDENKLWLDMVTEDNWMEHKGVLRDPDHSGDIKDIPNRSRALTDPGLNNSVVQYGTDGLTVRNSTTAKAVRREASLGQSSTSSKKHGGSKGAAKEETKLQEDSTKTIVDEFTFFSAKEAADFQGILLALRVMGKQIRNMYGALELLHMSSDAYLGDDAKWSLPADVVALEERHGMALEKEKKGGSANGDNGQSHNPRPPPPAGVALDDILRCLGEIKVNKS